MSDACNMERVAVSKRGMAELCLEVVTRLGNSVIEIEYVDVAQLADLPTRRGLASVEVRMVERPTRELPRSPIQWRVVVSMLASAAMHLFIISIALRSEDVPTSGASPRQRTRLVANHASSPRAAQADKTVASTDTIDSRQSSHRREPSRPAPHAPPRERVPVAPAPAPEDGTGPRDSEMPRHFDPCADNDCGLIASAPYATAGRGREAGDDYQLRPHRELSLSVVTCDEVLGCKTVTGDDQDDIRAEVGRHVAALDACFDTATAGATSAVEVRAVDGTIRARAHDGDALGSCLAAALGRLELHADHGDVTIAFTRG
jgi:hypothetical protein